MSSDAPTFAPRRGVARPQDGRAYSRFVYLTKLALPVTAVALILLVAAWPRLDGVFENLHLGLPRIDLSQARDLRMVDARYSGVDRENRPFTVTADIARQTPSGDGPVTLDHPKGDLSAAGGSWLELAANTGVYQPQPQLLDLSGDVALYQDKGNEFHSTSAHLDMAAGTATGDAPVTGQGPFGSVSAQGFRILDHGATIVFTGHATLDLQPRTGSDGAP